MDLAARVATALERGAQARGLHEDVDVATAHLEQVLETSAPDQPAAVAAAQAVLSALEGHALGDPHEEVPHGVEDTGSDHPGESASPPQRPHRIPVSGWGTDDGEH